MVGIVIVSHSQKLAEGVVEIATMMAADAPIAAAGGLEEGGFGTSFERIVEAVQDVDQGAGVAILMDMGSAVMTAEMVCEALDDTKIRLLDAPLVEGAVLAAVESQMGTSLDDLAAKIGEARDVLKLSSGV